MQSPVREVNTACILKGLPSVGPPLVSSSVQLVLSFIVVNFKKPKILRQVPSRTKTASSALVTKPQPFLVAKDLIDFTEANPTPDFRLPHFTSYDDAKSVSLLFNFVMPGLTFRQNEIAWMYFKAFFCFWNIFLNISMTFVDENVKKSAIKWNSSQIVKPNCIPSCSLWSFFQRC